jgi:Bacterial extracellular solute-binding proteins, family 3
MVRPYRKAALLYLILALTVGCDVPRDAEGTLARVRNGTMRIGFTANDPWVRLVGDQVAGIEPALLRQWAEQLGTRVEWVSGSEASLVEALHKGELDVIVAGLLSDTPFSSKLGLSQPYIKARIRFAVPPGTPPPEDWAGRPVAVAPDRLAIRAMIREEEAMPTSPGAFSPSDLAVAAYDFEIEARGLVPADPVLATERHVIATRPGESAFLLALDRFLQDYDEAKMLRLAAEAATR